MKEKSRPKSVPFAKRALWFLLTAALLFGLLLCCTLVPKDVLRPQMQQSADYLCEKEYLFDALLPGVDSSRQDRYADSILLGIAWQYDSADPVRSTLISAYYSNPHQGENLNLRDAVTQDLPANQQYLRYWHGSAGILRLLMSVLSLQQVYIFHGIVLAVLAAGLLLRLLRRRMFAAATGIAVGLVGVNCWFIPISLEFTWVFLILLVQLHIVLNKSFPQDPGRRAVFFLVSGMITNFLDFLTCESLTLLMPLLMLMLLDRDAARPRMTRKALLRIALDWAVGYGGMYLLKWGLAGIVMGENPLPYVTSHIGERMVGSVEGYSFFEILIMSLRRNVTALFPAGYDVPGMLAGIALLVAAGYIGYVHHRDGFDKGWIWTCALFGAIPFLRYVTLVNHSYLHGFFTHRALMITLFALVLILAELTGWGQKKHGQT